MLEGHKGGINAIALDANSNTVYSGSDDKSVRAWDTNKGVCLAVYEGHCGIVSCLALHGNHVFSGSYDKSVIRWIKP